MIVGASDGQQVEVAVSCDAANVCSNRGGLIDRCFSLFGGENAMEVIQDVRAGHVRIGAFSDFCIL
jgi:hypothetical protein